MFSDWICKHKERNATEGGAPMEGCSCCLQGERKGCRLVNITVSSPMSSDWMREHKDTNATKGGAPIEGCCVAFRAKESGVVS